MHEAARTSTLTGGEISTTPCRSRHVDGHGESDHLIPNVLPLPGSASIGAKFISTKSETCANDAATELRGVGQCSRTRLFWGGSSYMVHHGASTRRARPLDAPRKIPVPSHVPGDTSGHGRWTATTRKRQCDGIGTVRWEGAMQTPSRSRTPGARKTTSKTCGQVSRSCQKA